MLGTLKVCQIFLRYIRDRSSFTRDLGGGININQAQRGGQAKKSSQERGAMYLTALTMGWASFFTPTEKGGPVTGLL